MYSHTLYRGDFHVCTDSYDSGQSRGDDPGSPGVCGRTIQAMEIKLGLDQPKLTQFIDYIGNVLHGDFGTSYMYNQRYWI